jgi:starch synthase
MVDQKGLDLIAAVQDELPHLGASFVVLGTGATQYQQMWERLAARHPDRIGVVIGFDERLAHLIEGGADIFLMPSRFEPCGLNQMYSLRYGTVPVVRATGGLDDTVRDYAPRPKRGNGFKFEEYLPGAMLAALKRAIETYGRKDVWRALQLEGMREDFSWRSSAAEYVKVYGRAAARPRS